VNVAGRRSGRADRGHAGFVVKLHLSFMLLNSLYPGDL
jgi:hypothetical protein